MNLKIATIRGDGIGPEIVDSAVEVLKKTAEVFGHKFTFNYVDMGGCAIDKFGVPLPDETLNVCKDSDSVLLGAVGGDKWDNVPSELRPERGLLKIRKELKLFANIRPVKLYSSLRDKCPLRADIVRDGIDLVVVRELTGGIYFGEKKAVNEPGNVYSYDVEKYSDYEIERILRSAFEYARKRGKRLTSVDKANVLESSKLWRRIANEVAKDYPDVTLEHMYVDNCAMQLVLNPRQFDVIVTSNIFGDILTDEASVLGGSIGMMASESRREDSFGLFEPIHGSAPSIAGKNIANPIATISSAAMLLRAQNLLEEAAAIENAIDTTLHQKYRTVDIFDDDKILVGTAEMAKKIMENIY